MRSTKACISLFLILLSAIGYSQQKVQFTVLGDIPFDGLSISYSELIDLNNDGADDLFVIYRDEQSTMITRVLLNDGKGNFNRDIPSPFIGLSNPLVDFGDVDDDGDMDIIIAGNLYSNSISPNTYLYVNTGLGRFVQSTTNSFTGFTSGAVKFFDADNDADLDIIISGKSASLGIICQLYLNNGIGDYQLKTDTILEGRMNGDIGISDMDNDGDDDLIISGSTQNTSPLKSIIYENDGNANFTKSTSNVDNLTHGEIAFIDINGDGYKDLTITGYGGGIKNKLYLNDSLGGFTASTTNAFFPNSAGTTVVVDIDDDGDEDILFSGHINSGTRTGLYINNGNGTFTLNSSIGYLNIGLISNVSDIDNDGDLDILVSGYDSTLNSQTKVFLNDGATNFSPKHGESIVGVQSSAVSLADVNNDSIIDVFVSGSTSNLPRPVTKLYVADSILTFKESINTVFDQVYKSSISFSDVDGDSDQDLFISGETANNTCIAKLYLNNGSGVFAVSTSSSFIRVKEGSSIFHDVDDDGDLDLLLQGLDSANLPISKLYFNNGSGVFSVSVNNFKGVRPTKSLFVDLDGDNDDDLIISGDITGSPDKTYVYKNNGSGTFSRDSINYSNMIRSWVVDYLDLDTDGDEDLLMRTPFRFNSFYRNNGSGNFVKDNTFNSAFFPMTPTDQNHPSTNDGKFFDVDNDGDMDLISIGRNRYGRATANLYLNDTGKFSYVDHLPFHGSYYGGLSVADLDNDGDQDLVISGANYLNNSLTTIYINRTCNLTYDTITQAACNSFLSPSGKVWTQSGIYNDTIESYKRCDSIITINLSITSPDTTVIDFGNFLQSNSTGKLQWLNCDVNFQAIVGDTNQLFYPPASGNYSLSVEESGCIDTSRCFSFIITNTITNRPTLENLKLYPNPTNHSVTILLPTNLEKIDYELYTINGRSISSGQINQGNNSLLNSTAERGIYIIRLIAEEEIIYKKIIKK